MSEQRNTELGDFLRSRRAALAPAESGVPIYGTVRRVPGLRREEVALLAGVSVNYYARIEQGESHQMSESVVEAIANALRLDDNERLHLLRLAWPGQRAQRDPGPEKIRDSLLALVESNSEQAALIVGRYMDLLGANRLGYALFGLTQGQRPNLAKQVVLEPAMRDLMVNWADQVRNVAAYLRMATGDLSDDTQLAELIGELSIKSSEFARFWAVHPVSQCTNGVYELDHPMVGRLTLNEETLGLGENSGQRIIFLGAAHGSDSAQRLRLLDSLIP
ncbi:helix-turn-helix transcriptional regulator [Planotetraspora mira]|uniref:DNA-binding protein n=1 Tax=Planotetraspora mira TaxID=58121 RepID=A0A8J3TW39_9ACTN|nr:helix-turn-helix transcriptional regulator [Planotetraspora mira]GII28260.1 DNA-binding protein [Planotetraspora mira]